MKRKYGVGSDEGGEIGDEIVTRTKKKESKEAKPKKKRKSLDRDNSASSRRSSTDSTSTKMEFGSPPGLQPSEYSNRSFDSDESMPKRQRKTSMCRH